MSHARTPFLSAALGWLGGNNPAGHCDRCGFEWSLSGIDALHLIDTSPQRVATLLEGRDGMAEASDGGWNATAYVWHLTDMARGWSERWAQLRVAPGSLLIGWDLDQLAIARNYTSLPTAPAVWALEHSVGTFVSLSGELPTDTTFLHGEWGRGTVGDVVVWLAHEHVHHERDIDERTANPPWE